MTNDLNILWAECQQILRDNLSQSAYQTWFAPIVAQQWDNDLLVLQVKSQFVVDYIEDNYLDILSRVLRKVFGAKVQLEYRIMMAGSSIDIPSDSAKQPATRQMMEQSASPIINEAWESQLNIQYTFCSRQSIAKLYKFIVFIKTNSPQTRFDKGSFFCCCVYFPYIFVQRLVIE